MPETLDSHDPRIQLRFAAESDCGLIREFISDLAEYEKLSHEMVADVEALRAALFGERRYAEVILADVEGAPAGFALFFHNFSTFLGKPGLYLEDLFVREKYRGQGVGKLLLTCLAKIAVERDCGRFEWAVLDWNKPAIDFYEALGAKPMDEWTTFRVTGKALEHLSE